MSITVRMERKIKSVETEEKQKYSIDKFFLE